MVSGSDPGRGGKNPEPGLQGGATFALGSRGIPFVEGTLLFVSPVLSPPSSSSLSSLLFLLLSLSLPPRGALSTAISPLPQRTHLYDEDPYGPAGGAPAGKGKRTTTRFSTLPRKSFSVRYCKLAVVRLAVMTIGTA